MRRRTINDLMSDLKAAEEFTASVNALVSALEAGESVCVKVLNPPADEWLGSLQKRLWSDALLAAIESGVETARLYVNRLDAHHIKHSFKLPNVRALRRKYGVRR